MFVLNHGAHTIPKCGIARTSLDYTHIQSNQSKGGLVRPDDRSSESGGGSSRQQQLAADSSSSFEVYRRTRFGVPPCHALWSRIMTLPAGTGLVVASFIQRGSSSRDGISSLDF